MQALLGHQQRRAHQGVVVSALQAHGRRRLRADLVRRALRHGARPARAESGRPARQGAQGGVAGTRQRRLGSADGGRVWRLHAPGEQGARSPAGRQGGGAGELAGAHAGGEQAAVVCDEGGERQAARPRRDGLGARRAARRGRRGQSAGDHATRQDAPALLGGQQRRAHQGVVVSALPWTTTNPG